MLISIEEVEQLLKQNQINYSAIYLYGSQIYGTASEKSDYDFLVITKDVSEQSTIVDIEISLETEESFLSQLYSHDIKAIECIFNNEKFKVETDEWKQKIKTWRLDHSKLRIAVSTKASNSWIKAKKKIEIDKEIYIGLKSLFHSLRMIEFAIQLIDTGQINYSSTNKYWDEIKNQSSWPELKAKYQPVYNALKTEFRNKTS